MRPSDVEILLGDSSKFRADTGWAPEIPFDKTLKDTFDYWQERIAAGRARLNMHVLITGITGFIGIYLARRLTAVGARVSGLSSDPLTSLPGVKADIFPQVDICDAEALRQVLERCDPQAVVHLAGLSHVGESWKRPGDYLRVNFSGTRNLLRAAGERRVIFASSSEVYGPGAGSRAAHHRGAAARSALALCHDQGLCRATGARRGRPGRALVQRGGRGPGRPLCPALLRRPVGRDRTRRIRGRPEGGATFRRGATSCTPRMPRRVI